MVDSGIAVGFAVHYHRLETRRWFRSGAFRKCQTSTSISPLNPEKINSIIDPVNPAGGSQYLLCVAFWLKGC
jgi:hypothetical protein